MFDCSIFFDCFQTNNSAFFFIIFFFFYSANITTLTINLKQRKTLRIYQMQLCGCLCITVLVLFCSQFSFCCVSVFVCWLVCSAIFPAPSPFERHTWWTKWDEEIESSWKSSYDCVKILVNSFWFLSQACFWIYIYIVKYTQKLNQFVFFAVWFRNEVAKWMFSVAFHNIYVICFLVVSCVSVSIFNGSQLYQDYYSTYSLHMFSCLLSK